MPGDAADPNRAIAADHERRLAVRHGACDASCSVPDDLDDLSDVLGATILPIGAPAPDLAIPVVADVDTGISKQCGQPCFAQGHGCALLTRREGTRACRDSDQREWLPPHPRNRTSPSRWERWNFGPVLDLCFQTARTAADFQRDAEEVRDAMS
jgi:hypothetical protein